MGQLRGLMYLGFVVAVVAGWVFNRQRNKKSKSDIKSTLQHKQSLPLDMALVDPNWTVRLQALQSLIEDHTQNILDTLLGFLADSALDIRQLAMDELATYGNEAIGGLGQILSTGDLTARESAIQVLLKIGTPATSPILINSLMFDESAWVRVPAAQGLGIIGGEDATEALIRSLKDTHPDVQDAVHQALEHIGTPQALSAIR